jgi:hypothetical protein
MTTPYIALVSNSTKVTLADTTRIAAALQKQLDNDFAPNWNINATIRAFNLAVAAPEGSWLIGILDNIGKDAKGFHNFERSKPKAFVTASANLNQVSRTCSHELLEMVANPTFNELSDPSVPPADSNLPPELSPDTPVQYLKEICDPCQAGRDSYEIDGITVCDFCLPNYYDGTDGRDFYHTDGRLREVRPGSYVTFRKEEDQTWWQTDKFANRLRTRRTTAPEALEALPPLLETTHSSPLRQVPDAKPTSFDWIANVALRNPWCRLRYRRSLVLTGLEAINSNC